MLKAVIFDFDGTLVDSESIHMKALKDTIKRKLNVDVKLEDIGRLAGMTYAEKTKRLLQNKGIEFDENEISREAYDYFSKIYESEVKLRNDVEKTLKLISNLRLKIGLYSPNSKHILKGTLKRFGILDYFQIIVGSEDIKRAKPDPEGYLIAAERLEVKPEECLVFEDTPTGFTSAKEAGMKVIVLDNPYLESPQYPGADGFIKGFEEVDENFFEKF